MIAFATLFLGLVVGIQTVEVVAAEEVAFVEVRLDGEAIAVMESPLWRVSCDFGIEPFPRRLVAVAFDSEGEELGRVEQILNVPRPAAEAEMVVEEGEQGRGATAQLRWESKLAAEPSSWAVSFDGEALEIADPRLFELPEYDPETIHFVHAELDFPGGVSATAESIFGGRYGSNVAAQLFAAPVELGRRNLRPLEAAAWLAGPEGEELEVVAVEKGHVDIVVVVDPSARSDLDRAVTSWRQRTGRRGSRFDSPRSNLRELLPMKAAHRLHLIWPEPETHERASHRYNLFPRSDVLSPWDGGLLYHLLSVRRDLEEVAPPRLADAVAAAGLQAAVGNDRRVVVLLLGSGPVDASQLGPVSVRRYLASLRVPLVVWSTAEGSEEKRTAWGEATEVSSVSKLERAFDLLTKRVNRQRVVWIDGAYLPQEVVSLAADELVPAGSGVVESFELEEELVASAAAWQPWQEASTTGGEESDQRGFGANERRSPADERLARARRMLGDAEVVASLSSWTLHTDVEAGGTRTAIDRVAERIESAYEERFGLVPGPAADEIVVLFEKERDYRAYEAVTPTLKGLESAGAASEGMAVLFSGDRRREEVLRVFVHEVTHLLNRRVAATPPMPWLEEGMATELEFCRIESDGEIRLGTLARSSGSSRVLRGPDGRGALESTGTGPRVSLVDLIRKRRIGLGIPLAELLNESPEEFLRSEGLRLRYATAGFFVRFLLEGREGRWREPFRDFLAQVAAGGPSDQAALEAALGLTVAELETELDTWLRFTAATLRFTQQ